MKALIFTALGALALSGCTGTHISPPTVCNGKYRRPANMYGSILPELPVPVPPSVNDGRSMVDDNATTSPPTAQPDASKPTQGLSRKQKREVALSYVSC
jgi:hypothetical protein